MDQNSIEVGQLAETLWRASYEFPDWYSFQKLPDTTKEYWRRVARVAIETIGGELKAAQARIDELEANR